MQMMRAKCAKGCGDFDVVSIPMNALQVSHIMMARNTCPICGNIRGNIVAEPRPLTEEECKKKTRAIAFSLTSGE